MYIRNLSIGIHTSMVALLFLPFKCVSVSISGKNNKARHHKIWTRNVQLIFTGGTHTCIDKQTDTEAAVNGWGGGEVCAVVRRRRENVRVKRALQSLGMLQAASLDLSSSSPSAFFIHMQY